jgi:hypothetical protein
MVLNSGKSIVRVSTVRMVGYNEKMDECMARICRSDCARVRTSSEANLIFRQQNASRQKKSTCEYCHRRNAEPQSRGDCQQKNQTYNFKGIRVSLEHPVPNYSREFAIVDFMVVTIPVGSSLNIFAPPIMSSNCLLVGQTSPAVNEA